MCPDQQFINQINIFCKNIKIIGQAKMHGNNKNYYIIQRASNDGYYS
jgi:hypothetical protein